MTPSSSASFPATCAIRTPVQVPAATSHDHEFLTKLLCCGFGDAGKEARQEERILSFSLTKKREGGERGEGGRVVILAFSMTPTQLSLVADTET
jgi:hypothetical protein